MQRLREIAPDVLVATVERGTTSTVVVAEGGGCLVVDPAMTAADVSGLAASIRKAGLRPQLGFATHPHWDHVLWSRDLGDGPRYAAPTAVTTAEQDRDEIVSYVRGSVSGHDLELVGRRTPGATVTPSICGASAPPDSRVIVRAFFRSALLIRGTPESGGWSAENEGIEHGARCKQFLGHQGGRAADAGVPAE